MASRLKMCIINPELVDDIAPFTGSQDNIMTRLGISWNSWTKIIAGEPIRLSLGLRLKQRIISKADEIPNLHSKFPSSKNPRELDVAALDHEFLREVEQMTRS